MVKQLVEVERVIYETLVGRVADSHWWRVKQTMKACELKMDKGGFELLIGLRKTSPKFYSSYHKIKARLTKEIEPQLDQGMTGLQFIRLLEKEKISPNQSTVSRWFVRAGGYKRNGFYSKTVLLPIAAVALIYLNKQANKLGV